MFPKTIKNENDLPKLLDREDRQSILYQLGAVMQIPHTAGDILNCDWMKILFDLERGRSKPYQVVAIANAAFALSTISPWYYKSIVEKTAEFAGQPLGYFLTTSQKDIIEEIKKFYSSNKS